MPQFEREPLGNWVNKALPVCVSLELQGTSCSVYYLLSCKVNLQLNTIVLGCHQLDIMLAHTVCLGEICFIYIAMS